MIYLKKNAQYFLGILLIICGVSGSNFRVFLLGALVSDIGFEVAKASDLVASSAGGLLVGSFFMVVKVRSINRRFVVFISVISMVIGTSSSILWHGYGSLLCSMFLSGFGEGLLISTGASIISSSDNPTRFVSLQAVLGSFVASVMAYNAPGLVKWEGVNGLFWALLGFSFVSFCIAFFVSDYKSSSLVKSGVFLGEFSVNKRKGVFLMAFSTLILFTGIGSFWPFIETIAVDAGVSRSVFGVVISAGMILGGLIGCVVAVLGDRYGYLFSVFIGCLFMMLSVILVELYMNAGSVYLIVPVFMMSGSLVVIFHNSFLASLDPSGRVMIIGLVMESMGGLVGPVFSGAVLRLGGNYSFISWALIISIIIYLCLRLFCHNRLFD